MFSPYNEAGGGSKAFSHAEGGGGGTQGFGVVEQEREHTRTKGFGVVLTLELEVLAILKEGERKKFPSFKRGAWRVSPCLE